MKITDFYKKFNEIVSNHKSAADTKAKLVKLNESIKGTDIESKVNIDININIADELEKQRVAKEEELKGLVSIDEEYDHYDESYEDSYDGDDDY